MKITRESVKRPVAVTVMMLAVAVIGIFGFTSLPVNLLPDITYPLVKVYVNWRGATPEEIEDNIAEIVEPRMATVDKLDYLESQCADGVYSLMVNFNYNADRDVAYQDVTAKIGLIRKKLPQGSDEPLIIKADPSQLPVIDIMVISKQLDLVKLRSWVETDLQKQFTAVEGTAGTEISGGLIREIRVIVNPIAMQAMGITAEKLIQALKGANIELAAGRIIGEQKEFTVRTLGRFRNIDDIKNIILSRGNSGGYVYLRDIAKVQDTSDVQRIITRMNGVEGVKLSIFKQADANTIDVEERIIKKMSELNESLPADIKMEIVYNQATYIRSAVNGVRDAALIAAILVMIATWFFLSGWKRVLIVFATLPISLLFTFFIMKIAGYSFNILSLGGLVIAITVILDNTVVVLENITRLQEEGESDAVEKGADQVGPALTYATLTFLAIFLPFLMIPGLVSLLFHELIVLVAVAIAFSRIAASTITPMLAAYFYRSGHSDGSENTARDRFMERITEKYSSSLEKALDKRRRIMIITLVIFIAGTLLFRFVGTEFLPRADDGMVMVKVKMPIGTSMKETYKVIHNIEEVAGKLPSVKTVSSLTGGSIWGLVTSEIANEGQVDIQLVPEGKRKITTDEFVARYAETLQKAAKYPGAKVKAMHTKMKGIRQTGDFDVEIEVRAPKTASIKDMAVTAQTITENLKGVKNLTNIDISLDVTKPEYHILLNRDRISDLGLTVNQVASTARMLIDGVVSTYHLDEGYYYPVRVVLGEEAFRGKIDIGNIPLMTAGGFRFIFQALVP